MSASNDAVTSPTNPRPMASGWSGSLTRLVILVGIAVVVQAFQDHLPELLAGIPWITPVLDALELPLAVLVAGELLRLAFLGVRASTVKIRAYFKHVKVRVTVEVPRPGGTDDSGRT